MMSGEFGMDFLENVINNWGFNSDDEEDGNSDEWTDIDEWTDDSDASETMSEVGKDFYSYLSFNLWNFPESIPDNHEDQPKQGQLVLPDLLDSWVSDNITYKVVVKRSRILLQWKGGPFSHVYKQKRFSQLRTNEEWDYDSPSVLHVLARHARVKVIERILDEGICVDARVVKLDKVNPEVPAKHAYYYKSVNATALHYAMIGNSCEARRETIQSLLAHGADPDAKGCGKRGHIGTCFDFAIQEGKGRLKLLRKEVDAAKGFPPSLLRLSTEAVKSFIWRQVRRGKITKGKGLFEVTKAFDKAIEQIQLPPFVVESIRFEKE